MKISGVFLVLFIISYAKSQDKCNSHNDSCNECIRELGCLWSVNQNAEHDSSKCFSNNNTSACRENVYNPGSSISVIEDLPIGEQTIVSPQKIQAHLRLHTPVYFKVTFASNQDSLVLPHHQNIIVQLLRTRPDFAIVKVEAVGCPKESTAFRQTVALPSTQGKQSVTLDVYLNCECPF